MSRTCRKRTAGVRSLGPGRAAPDQVGPPRRIILVLVDLVAMHEGLQVLRGEHCLAGGLCEVAPMPPQAADDVNALEGGERPPTCHQQAHSALGIGSSEGRISMFRSHHLGPCVQLAYRLHRVRYGQQNEDGSESDPWGTRRRPPMAADEVRAPRVYRRAVSTNVTRSILPVEVLGS